MRFFSEELIYEFHYQLKQSDIVIQVRDGYSYFKKDGLTTHLTDPGNTLNVRWSEIAQQKKGELVCVRKRMPKVGQTRDFQPSLVFLRRENSSSSNSRVLSQVMWLQ